MRPLIQKNNDLPTHLRLHLSERRAKLTRKLLDKRRAKSQEIKCTHGMGPQRNPCSKDERALVCLCLKFGEVHSTAEGDKFAAMVEKCPELFIPAYRDYVRSWYLRFAADAILNGEDLTGDGSKIVQITMDKILFLDMLCEPRKVYTATDFMSQRDALDGCVRSLLKFFSKQLTCSCLDKKYAEVRRSYPQIGRCAQCDKKSKRSDLLLCGRCMLHQYCSHECQKKAWTYHKATCDRLTTPLGEDPCFRKYFQMLEEKVPRDQVEKAIASDGQDPRVLLLDPNSSFISQLNILKFTSRPPTTQVVKSAQLEGAGARLCSHVEEWDHQI